MWEISPENLAAAMDRAGVNQSQLAADVGLKQPSIGRLLSGETKTTRAIRKIAVRLKTSPAFLRGETDDPEPVANDDDLYVPADASSPEAAADKLNSVLVPQLEIGYSMGGGSVFEDFQQTDLVPFPRNWLAPMIKGAFADLFVARGEGDSMMPTLLDGDLVIVDTSQKRIDQQDRLWCLSYGELGMIKRVRQQPDGGIQVLSDNPAVSPFTAYDEEVHVIGRVVWIGRRV